MHCSETSGNNWKLILALAKIENTTLIIIKLSLIYPTKTLIQSTTAWEVM